MGSAVILMEASSVYLLILVPYCEPFVHRMSMYASITELVLTFESRGLSGF